MNDSYKEYDVRSIRGARVGVKPGDAFANILSERGLQSLEELEHTNNETVEQWLDGMPDMAGLQDAADEVVRALDADEKIMIYGDYDVDGATAVSLLLQAWLPLGAKMSYRIPSHEKDGYGLHAHLLDEVAQTGAKLLVTVDTGVTGAAEVAHAQTLGMRVVVTDHHQMPKDLARYPSGAEAVVNPQRPDCPWPHKGICGTTVAWLLARRVLQMRLGDAAGHARAMELIDLVALATVADCMPLTELNRALVRHGLTRMRTHTRPGLAALLEVAGVEKDWLDATALGYAIGPRLNAAGRVAHAGEAVALLMAAPDTAKQRAEHLQRRNEERKAMLGESLQRAIDALEVNENDRVIIAVGDYHVGIVGLVAGRLAEKYGRPALALGMHGDEASGSARSVPGVNVYTLLQSVSQYFLRFGGHAMAAGFRLNAADLPAWQQALQESARQLVQPEDLEPMRVAAGELHPEQLTLHTVALLHAIGPFGQGSPEPLFLLPRVRIAERRVVGKTQEHLHLWCEMEGGKRFKIAAFGMARLPQLAEGATLDMLVKLGRSRWQGQDRLEIYLEDAI